MTPSRHPTDDTSADAEPSSARPAGRCPGCGAPRSVVGFLSLGDLPLGNAFFPLSEVTGEERFPLEMGFCERCFLVQVIEPAPLASLEKVYRNYSYVPTGKTLEDHYTALAADVLRVVRPSEGALFADIGSNDGLFLSKVLGLRRSARVVGVEPSTKPFQAAQARGIPTVHRFFDGQAVEQIRSGYGPAEVVSATQVLQHIRDPLAFLGAVHEILDPDGVLVLEGRAYFPDVADKVSFDTFYHELLFCFTLHSLVSLLDRAGYVVVHAEHQGIYGGSLRVYAQKRSGRRPVLDSVARTIDWERSRGVRDLATYRSFASKVAGARRRLTRTVAELKAGGRTIVGYGAPSTGNTLLNYCGLGSEFLEYVVDDNPMKQGLVTPGTHLPIVSSEALHERCPDYILVIAWRLKDEIVAKLAPLRDRGLKGMIIPLPEPEVLA